MAALLHALATLLIAGVARGQDYAIARPFATSAEVQALQLSFAHWNTFLPCDKATAHPVDLFLIYSRKLSEDAGAKNAVDTVLREFQSKSQPWHVCFRAIKVLSANLTAEQDVYDPKSQDTNPNWVSGPNNVFRFTLRNFVGSTYRAFFFMELDSWPQRANWLDQFLREAATPDVAIRGSRYRGDKWDDFLLQMPEAIRVHINGNAIYFVQNPFMIWLNEQLQIEANITGDSVAFDVRMAELVLATVDTKVWRDLVPAGSNPYLGDSKLIGNYANTLINKSFDQGEYITHVAKSNIFSNLPDLDVTLAVSHFSNANYSIFSSSLETLHPFRKIIILTKDTNAVDGQVDSIATPVGTTQMTWKNQSGPVNMTLCELANLVDTTFFVFSDTFHAIASPVSILMDNNKPVVPIMHADSKYCMRDQRCLHSLQQAHDLFNVSLTEHYEMFDTLFKTKHARAFCAAWEDAEAALVSRNPDTCLPLTGPSADDYFAWLSLQGSLVDEYKPVNREIKGWRVFANLHTPHPVDPRPCGVYKEEAYDWTASNISYCAAFVEQPDVCQDDPQCMWRPIFASGKCIPRVSDLTQDWTVTETQTASTTKATTATGTATTTVTTTKPAAAPTTTATTTPTATTFRKTQTQTTTATTTPEATTTTITTTAVKLSNFASVILKLNTQQPLKSLLQKVVKGAAQTLQGKTGAAAKAVVRVKIESLQLATFILNLTVPNSQIQELYSRADPILAASKRAYCNRLTADQCDFGHPNNPNGLRARKGTRQSGRQLQGTSGFQLPFEAFTILNDEQQLTEMRELKSPAFLPALEKELHAEMPDTTFRRMEEIVFTPPNETAEAVISYDIPEEARADVPALQAELADPAVISNSLFQANNDATILVEPPVVDLCLNRDCGGQGSCRDGVCHCDAGFTGVNCLLTSLVEEVPFTVTVPADGQNVPLVISLSLLTTCMLWVIPCSLYWFYYKHKVSNEKDAQEEKKVDEEENPQICEEAPPFESEDGSEDSVFI